MTKQETYIEFIKEEFKKGNVKHKNVVSIFCNTFCCTDRTFDKYWKLANISFGKYQSELIENVRESIENKLKSNAKEAYANSCIALLKIINKECLVEEKCYDISIGKVVVFEREYNPIEVIEAIKEYNRINGI
jgi:hypothetical protein